VIQSAHTVEEAKEIGKVGFEPFVIINGICFSVNENK